MAFKKRYYRVRKYRKRPSFHRKFKRYTRRTKAVRVHYFKRTMVAEGLVKDWGWSGYFAPSPYESKLEDLPNYTEFTALYDSYKICGIKKKFVFSKTSADVDGDATNELPVLVTINDYNDKVLLSSEAIALQYPSYKARRLDKVVSRYYKPSICLTEASKSGLMSTKSRWLSTANPDVEHFGLKWAIETMGDTSQKNLGHLRVYTTFYIACMGQR